jgi:hypothetical protein
MAGSVAEAFRASFGFVPSEAVMDMLIGTDSDFVVAALQTLESEWGSIAAYFEASGVDAGRQQQLRTALLE